MYTDRERGIFKKLDKMRDGMAVHLFLDKNGNIIFKILTRYTRALIGVNCCTILEDWRDIENTGRKFFMAESKNGGGDKESYSWVKVLDQVGIDHPFTGGEGLSAHISHILKIFPGSNYSRIL